MDRLFAELSGFTLFSIAAILIAALIFHVRWTRRTSAIGPTILTTLGIFFCFAGIAWGLLDFNPSNVRDSVPHLLQGIRTSFWASVAGIFCALTLKFRVALLGDPKLSAAGSQEGATVGDLAHLLTRLTHSIAGNEDSTLLSQLKLLRSDNNEHLDRLNKSFDRYAEKMAEANSKALIEALSQVIRDFNTKLNEQFGENFKQLNAAVEKLVVWQAQYETQLNALIEQETATRKSMTEAALRYTDLVSKSSRFTDVASSLEALLSGLNTQRDQLTAGLRSLAELVNTAATGLPTIEKRIVEMTRQIESGVRENQDALGAVIKTSAQAVQAHQQQLTTVLSKSLETANKDLNSHLRQASEDAKKQIVLLDKALEEELTKSIETLGRQLAALSQKFVQDYTPLTDRLQQLVRASRVA
jgi:hypothetical protein